MPTGIAALLDVLAASGVGTLFGNPGTTELPLNDALAGDARFRYVLGCHEVPVVAMADGYAMASGGAGVVNLHTACGLGNALGMLVNAQASGTPLVVTAGQQDRRLIFDEPVLSGDLVAMARPLVKWAAEVPRAADMASATRRALQVARTPPTGPVFLSLPLDCQSGEAGDVDTSAAWVPGPPGAAPEARVREAAEILRGARRPLIVAGSRVAEAGGCAELAALAEALGAPVYAEANSSHGRLPVAGNHPLYAGPLPNWGDEIHALLSPFDAVLAVGLNVLRLYIHAEPERPVPRGLPVIHLDTDPREIGKNVSIAVGMWADIPDTVSRLRAALGDIPGAAARAEGHARAVAAARERLRHRIDAEWAGSPLTPAAFMGAIARVLPTDAAVVHESPTSHRNALERLGHFADPAGHFAPRGWALGWGMGCAVGVKLAWPDRPVLAVIGDGSALYGIQALWTAARYRIPVTFVIANNRRYRILQDCGAMLGLSNLGRPECDGIDLSRPATDFAALARGFGVPGSRVETADALADAVRDALASGGPALVEAALAE